MDFISIISNRHFLPYLNTYIGSCVQTPPYVTNHSMEPCNLNLEFRQAPNGAYTQINLKRLNFPLNGIGIDFFAHPTR